MHILHCNTYEGGGGAAIAANRLHRGLLAAGVDSRLAVAVSAHETPQVIPLGGKAVRLLLRPVVSNGERILAEAFYSRPPHPACTTFSLMPSLQHRRINALPRDVLHLHWVTDGFLAPWALARLRGPVIWTMHDTWPFTGGCHYPGPGCERYTASCGRCPELGSRRAWDLSRLHWRLKRGAVKRIRPVIISPSLAYAERAARSGLLAGCRVEHIPNGIDTEIFRPLDKTQARHLLNLPQDAIILLFGAMNAAGDHCKGFDLLCQALSILLAGGHGNFLPVVFGASESDAGLPLPMRFLGRLHDNITLSLAYSAADVFVCPSRQDNLPNTVLESLACGTPVAAFAVGGIPDMVEHGLSGCLARPHEPEDLARGLARLLGNKEDRRRMGEAGRARVERDFAMPVVAKRHISLYEEMLAAEYGGS